MLLKNPPIDLLLQQLPHSCLTNGCERERDKGFDAKSSCHGRGDKTILQPCRAAVWLGRCVPISTSGKHMWICFQTQKVKENATLIAMRRKAVLCNHGRYVSRHGNFFRPQPQPSIWWSIQIMEAGLWKVNKEMRKRTMNRNQECRI
jgi:hypothetical protein